MSQSQEKTREPNQKLPNPELNPLLNPTLGNNLGRWAQAYFTSPPEKREEAVLELLHELEAENGGEDLASSEATTAAKWSGAGPGSKLSPSLTCAECGHENATHQRFCGMCGSRLVFSDESGEARPSTSREIREPAAIERPSVLSQPAEPLQVPTFSGLSLFATAKPSTASTSDSSDTDIQWLREKSYEGTDDESHGSATKYLVTAVGLLLLGVLFYAQWKPEGARPPVSTSVPSAAHPAPAAQTPEPASGSQASEKQTASAPEPAPPSRPTGNSKAEGETPATGTRSTANPATGDKVANAPESAGKPVSGRVRSGGSVQGEKPNSSAGSSAAQSGEETSLAGAADLSAAESFLSGKYGTRDSSQAARLLWRAVGKENTTAIVLLSNLYLTGDGVPKSCDQAKMLLRAAAQKNSAEAANKLRQLQRSGCP